MKKVWVLYDGRGKYDTDEATVLDTSFEEPEETPDDYGEAIWAEYDEVDGVLQNEHLRFDLLDEGNSG